MLESGSQVTAGQVIPAASLSGLVYTPNTLLGGSPYDSFSFQVQDNGDGNNTDSIARTMTINVTLSQTPHAAPSGGDNSIGVLEDSTVALTVANFGFSDNETLNPQDNFKAVRIASVPASGSLQFNGVPVAIGQFVLVTDISGGKLTFTPAANSSASANFTFQVQDTGLQAAGSTGQDLDPSANTLTFSVTSVNDAPAGADRAIPAFNEDGSYTLKISDFGFSDTNDTPANNFTGVILTTLPANGNLQLNGANITAAGTFVTFGDIQANKLVFFPVANTNGSSYANFTFQVKDDGGTASNAVDIDPSANTIAFTVNSVNDAPTATGRTIALPLSTATVASSYAFTAADFGFDDPNDSPENTLVSVTIVSLPTSGKLQLNGVDVVAGAPISAVNLNGNLKYIAPTSGVTASFTFQVRDNGGTANTGVDTSTTATMNISLGAVSHHVPTTGNNTVSTLEDAAKVFSLSDFSFVDNESPNPSDGFRAVIVDTLPSAAAGVLKNGGIAVTAGTTIQVSDITSGNLQFVPAANSSASSSFTFRVQDTGGTADTSTTATMTVNVTSVNDAPTAQDHTVAAGGASGAFEDLPYVFQTSDFVFADATDTPSGNSFKAVRIASVPTVGTLALNGAPVSIGQFIQASDIQAGALTFTGAANVSGSPYTSFTFQVQDNGGTQNSGVDLSVNSNKMALNLASVNDAPTSADRTLTTPAGSTYTFSLSDFPISDVEGDNLDAIQIGTLNLNGGTLTTNVGTVNPGDTILASTIAAGELKFTPSGSGFPDGSFTFRVRDDGGTADGGVDLSSAASTITFNVPLVNNNHEPAGSDSAISVGTLQQLTLTAANFGFSDPNDNPSNNLQAVKVAQVSLNGGSLTADGTAVTAGSTITVQDLTNGKILFTASNTAGGNVFITFQVQDDGGTPAQDTDQTPNTLTFSVFALNHAPTVSGGATTATEDITRAFVPADFGFTDADGNLLKSITITSVNGLGSLTNNGIAVGAGSVISSSDISSGLFLFRPAANDNGNSRLSFTFQAQDDGGTDNNGQDTSSEATISVSVTAVDDPPTFTVGADQAATDENPLDHGPALPKSITGWAQNLNAGPADESSQTLNFTVDNDNHGLFAVQPAIDSSGNLTFTAKPNASGTAVVTVTLNDSAGAASQSQTFNIVISKPHKFHNSADTLASGRNGRDVTGSTSIQPDGFIVAGDVLGVINYINANGSGPVNLSKSAPPYVDVDADDQVTATDALIVINWINAHPGQSEGEAPAETTSSSADSYFTDLGAFPDLTGASDVTSTSTATAASDSMNDLIALLAADTLTEQMKRRRAYS